MNGNPYLLLSELTLNAIQAEATRAHFQQKTKSILYKTPNDALSVLVEEVGEVAKELNTARELERPIDRDKLVKELVQVAAMAATMIEAVEGNHIMPYRRTLGPSRPQ